MKRYYKFALIFGVIFIVFFIYKFIPDERRTLKENISALKGAVEREDKSIILNYLDRDYLDNHGNNYEDITQNIDEFLNLADSIEIMISGLKIKIDSVSFDKSVYASCSLGLRVIARYEKERVPVFGGIIQPASVKGYFRKREKIYRLYSAGY